MSDALRMFIDPKYRFADRWRQSPAIVGRHMVAATNNLTMDGEAVAKRHAPVGKVRGGNMRNAITHEPARLNGMVVTGKFGVRAQSFGRFPYPIAVEFGRRGFVVRARNAQALRFTVGGRVLFRKSARVGPARPKPFIRPAAEHVRGRMGGVYKAGLRNAIVEITRGGA